MYDMQKMQTFLKKRLSRERFTHTMNVAKECERLAGLYGADPEKACFAGLVHDICKEDPKQQQYDWAVRSNMGLCPEEAASYKVWHGIAGAYFLRTEFGIADADILNAVRYHTVGRSGMSLLEKIVYLGDMISQERDYSGVEVMRRTCHEDSLELGMLYALRYTLRKQLKRNALIPHFTLEAYNEYTRMFPENTYHI
ncbi:MAG: bis(5'-nucleosyl)-tetraphosphatase (symmetrical) YqeK [Ruminococcus sp.]